MVLSGLWMTVSQTGLPEVSRLDRRVGCFRAGEGCDEMQALLQTVWDWLKRVWLGRRKHGGKGCCILSRVQVWSPGKESDGGDTSPNIKPHLSRRRTPCSSCHLRTPPTTAAGTHGATVCAPLSIAQNCCSVGGLGYKPYMRPGHTPHVAVVVCAVCVYMWG